MRTIIFILIVSLSLSVKIEPEPIPDKLQERLKALHTEQIWMGWIPRESGAAGFRQVGGDGGKAYGKYQFDYRYGLLDLLEDCKNYNPDHYSGFQKFIDMGKGNTSLINNTELKNLWLSCCDKYPVEFERLQDIKGYEAYYLEIKKYLNNLYQIQLDHHSSALKGSCFSMAIRTGGLAAAWKFEGLTDSSSDLDMMQQSYNSYGDEDAERWTLAKQHGDAIFAYNNNDYTEIHTSFDSEDVILPKVVKVLTDVYRRSTPDSSSGDNIVGTYTEGTIVDVLYKSGDFYQDTEGIYFSSKAENVADLTGKVNTDTVSVIAEPQGGRDAVAYAHQDEVLTIYKRFGDYYYIRVKAGGFGWIKKNYMDLL